MIFLLGKLYRFFVNKYFNNFFIRVSKEKFPKVLYLFFYLVFVFSPFLIAFIYYFLIRTISYYYVVPLEFLVLDNIFYYPLIPFYILYSLEILIKLLIYIHVLYDISTGKDDYFLFEFFPNVIHKIDQDHIITKIFGNLVFFLLYLINFFVITLPYTAPVLIIYFLYSMFQDPSDDGFWAFMFIISIIVTPFYYISLFEEKTGNKTNSTNGSNLFKGIIALGLYNKAKENRQRRESNRDF